MVLYTVVSLDHLDRHKMTVPRWHPPLWLNATWRVKLRSCGLKLAVVLTCYCLAWQVNLVCDSRMTVNKIPRGRACVRWGLQSWALDPDTGFGCAKAKLDWGVWLKALSPCRCFSSSACILLLPWLPLSSYIVICMSLNNMCMFFLFLSTSGKASGSNLAGCYSTNDASCRDSSLCTKQQGIQKQHVGNSLKRKKNRQEAEGEVTEGFASEKGEWGKGRGRIGAVVAVLFFKGKRKNKV